MTSPWMAGLQIRGLDGAPVADFLCGTCLHHERATGRKDVTVFLRTDPVASHRCNPAGEQPAAA